MKHLLLPINKFSRFAINVGFAAIWLVLINVIFNHENWETYQAILFNKLPFKGLVASSIFRSGLTIRLIVLLTPIALFSKFIWWGRFKPKSGIAKSREEEEAGRKWDSIVEELRNRK
ncbi:MULTISPECIES: hypothetical protein [unclassified Prochlorococcus]|uniref:hypothetical protein n=1 Tax=unclassified Prochlorococcus TaxID=2627481 RepID=UPI0005339EC2|nr:MULTISPECIES: hypothetical protein [unclassified Prochlorococcus]KGG17233.1 hypothetical protein EV07_0670 [Prochlorococcus sp. MIT 0603]